MDSTNFSFQYGPHGTSITLTCTCMSCWTMLTDLSYQAWWLSLWDWLVDLVVQGLHFSEQRSPARYRSSGHLLKHRPYPCLETTEARTEKPVHRLEDNDNTIKPNWGRSSQVSSLKSSANSRHFLMPLFQNNTSCKTFHMKISLIWKRMNL